MEPVGVTFWIGDGELAALYQQAADQVGGDDLCGAGEEAAGEGWDALGECGGNRSKRTKMIASQ